MPELRGGLALRIAAEALAWYALAGLFLAIYAGFLGGPGAAALPHLRLVTEAFLLLAAVRVALTAVLPLRAARAASTALAVAAFAVLVGYYAIQVMSLRSWGRVLTWDLMVSHGRGTWLMLDAMGMPKWAVAVAGALIASLLAVAAWLHARRADWAALVASRTRALPRATVAGLVAAVIVLDLHQYLILPPIDAGEPVSLTFFSARRAIKMQNHGVDRAAAQRRDAEQDAARAAYRPSPGTRRNVILIVSDALRFDHMGLYGYARDTTPNLARLRAAGIVRMAAPVRTVCSETFCGLMGLLSSRYVHQFSSRMFMLPEVLARNGYRTSLILGGDHSHFYGLREMYGKVDEYFDGSMAGERYMNDDQVLVDHVKGLPRWDGRPIMIRFHLMATHMLGKRQEASSLYFPAANYFFVYNRNVGDDGRTYEKAVNYYDNGVRGFDAAVAALLDELKAKGYLDEAVVAITGDHGEALGEHGLWGHENGLNEEVTRVPFLLLNYGYTPSARLDATPFPAQVDIAPTILAELGLPRPATWSGVPMQSAGRRDFINFEEGALVGLIDTRDPANVWKYWEDRGEHKASAFNLTKDPRESHDAIAEVPAGLLRDWRRELVPVKAQYVPDPWAL
jgi:glucan phosphoethanolaminetransferase (alkaline phosphatase superfamily)